MVFQFLCQFCFSVLFSLQFSCIEQFRSFSYFDFFHFFVVLVFQCAYCGCGHIRKNLKITKQTFTYIRFSQKTHLLGYSCNTSKTLYKKNATNRYTCFKTKSTKLHNKTKDFATICKSLIQNVYNTFAQDNFTRLFNTLHMLN